MDDADYAALMGLDDDIDAADAPLLDPGSDGLIYGGGTHLLEELSRRREEGASLAQLRRDAGEIDPFRVTDRVLEDAVEQGRRIRQYRASGRIADRPRQWRMGARLPTRAEWEAMGRPERRDRNTAHRA